MPGPSRTLVDQPRPRARSRPRICAPPKSALPASSIRRRWRSPRSTKRASSCVRERRLRPACSARRCAAGAAMSRPRSIFGPRRPRPTARRSSRRGRGGRDEGPRRHPAGRCRPARRPARPLGEDLRLGRRRHRRAQGSADRHLRPRDDRAADPSGELRPGAEDAGHRPARGRRRARLQQRADRHPRLFGPAAREPPADRPVLPGHHADQAERQPRGRAGTPTTGLLAAADAASGGPATRRRAVRPAEHDAAAGRREDRDRRQARPRPVAGEGRPQPVRAGHHQSRRERARRHAERRQDSGAHAQHRAGGLRRLQ